MPRLKLGTRQSRLAMIQAQMVADLCRSLGWEVELVPMQTSGDRFKTHCLADIGGKALFTKELEEALLSGTIDLAVHSMKDVESKRPHDLGIVAILPREDPRDVVVTSPGHAWDTLPPNALIGTSSPRRAYQAKLKYPQCQIVPFRGNVPTRLEKVHGSQVHATFLAAAGLKRLDLLSPHHHMLSIQEMVPAAGQGAIGIECLKKRTDVWESLVTLNHALTSSCVRLERFFLEKLQGDCSTPVGCLVTPLEDPLTRGTMHAFIQKDPNEKPFIGQVEGSYDALKAAAETWALERG